MLSLLNFEGSATSCNFDNGLCSGWSQSSSDDFDWTVRSGGTPSSGTGPSADHSGSGKYIYIETSSPRKGDDKAVLIFNGYTGGPACLSFFYHMYGRDINLLNVKLGSTDVFQKSGSQGNQWKKAEFSINGSGDIKFEGIRGSGYKGDIAIDKFSLTGGSCRGGSGITPPSSGTPVKCTFDSGLCSGWSQATSDRFDWTVQSGKTPSRDTGPSADHSGSGKYIYIETSSPRKPDDKAVVIFNGYTGGPACLSFYYHMYGKNVNQLNVNLGGTNVFQKSGPQGNQWKKAEVSINGRGNIEFEGIRGTSWRGDIAIDDFSLTGGSCRDRRGITPPPPVNPTQRPSSGNCGEKPSVGVIDGTKAMNSSWPWQAILRTTSGFSFCGGSLIAPQWVVSAAHCVKGKSPSSLTIRMGAHMRDGNVGTEQDFRVAKIISHPSYHKPLSYSHDIALIKLEKPALLNKAVGLVCVPDGNSPAMPIDSSNKKCWITGWGRLASGGATPDRLMQASVPLVSKARCLKGYPNKIHDSMLCAGLDQGGVDVCQGDSGGPLVCEYNGQWFLEGATSWGHECAGPMKYGVYAKVRYVKSWINQTMKSN